MNSILVTGSTGFIGRAVVSSLQVNNKIIASSIESHQYLKKIGIIHDLVDDYFTKFDYRKIDTTTNNFTLNFESIMEIFGSP